MIDSWSRQCLRGTLVVGAGVLLAALGGTVADAGPRTTVTVRPADLPPSAVLLSASASEDYLVVLLEGTVRIWRPGTDLVTVRPVGQPPGYPPVVPPLLAGPDGVLVGAVTWSDGSQTITRVDPATGRSSRLPPPLPAVRGLQLRGTNGRSLVYDAGPEGSDAGIYVQRIGSRTLRTVPVPRFDVRHRGVLDVTGSGTVLVSVLDSVATVDLATEAVTALPFVRLTGHAAEGVLVGDHLAVIDQQRPGRTVLHTCQISTATCTQPLSGDLHGLSADDSGFVVAQRTADAAVSDVVRGTWSPVGAAVTGRTAGGAFPRLVRTRSGLVQQLRVGAPAERVDPRTGTTTVLSSWPTTPGRFDVAWLDVGGLVTAFNGADETETTTRHPISGTAATGLTLGAPQTLATAKAGSWTTRGPITSGAWTYTYEGSPRVLTVRDGTRIAGRVATSTLAGGSGPWWAAADQGDVTVYRAGVAHQVVPDIQFVGVGDGFLTVQRPGSRVVEVTNLLHGTTTTFTAPGSAYVRQLSGSRAMLVTEPNDGSPCRITIVDLLTGRRVLAVPAPPGSVWAGLDGDLLVWQDVVNPGADRGARIVAQSLTTGARATITEAGTLLGAQGGRVAWWRPSSSEVSVTAVPTELLANRVGALRDLAAPATVARGERWHFSADADLVLTSWSLVLARSDGQLKTFRGTGPLGQVRAGWTPTAAGSWAWTLIADTETGQPLLDQTTGQAPHGSVVVTG